MWPSTAPAPPCRGSSAAPSWLPSIVRPVQVDHLAHRVQTDESPRPPWWPASSIGEVRSDPPVPIALAACHPRRRIHWRSPVAAWPRLRRRWWNTPRRTPPGWSSHSALNLRRNRVVLTAVGLPLPKRWIMAMPVLRPSCGDKSRRAVADRRPRDLVDEIAQSARRRRGNCPTACRRRNTVDHLTQPGLAVFFAAGGRGKLLHDIGSMLTVDFAALSSPSKRAWRSSCFHLRRSALGWSRRLRRPVFPGFECTGAPFQRWSR